MNTNNIAAEFDLDGCIQELARARAANELALSTGMIRLATYVQVQHFDFTINGMREISRAARSRPLQF